MNDVLEMIRCGLMWEFESRKKDHLRLSLEPESQSKIKSRHEGDPFDAVSLLHHPFPEMNLSEIDYSTVFSTPEIHQPLKTPFYIAAMTAGHEGANEINTAFARACEERGWIFCVGSLRRELESENVKDWMKWKKQFKSLLFIGNLGASQLSFSEKKEKKIRIEQIKKLIDATSPAAFAIHFNSLQEVIQKEGTPNFKGVLSFLQEWSIHFPNTPLVVKETGCGFSKKSLRELLTIKNLLAVDVSGFGGTHWGLIEGLRAKEKKDFLTYELSLTFKNWGISTVDSVRNAKEIFSKNKKTKKKSPEIWGSGGVKNGLEAAKLLSIGAHRVGFAGEALKALHESPKKLNQFMELKEMELKTALFCTGNKTIESLRS